MTFEGIDNPFGTQLVTAPGSATSTYYKGQKLTSRPRKTSLRAPLPPSHYLKKFLLS